MKRKNIIMGERDKIYEYDDLKDMVQQILGADYYELSKQEQYEKLKLRTTMNAMMRNLPIKDLTKGAEIKDIEDEQYILLNELTFLVSLAKNNDVVIYEKETSNQFMEGIEKESLERVSREYIRINDCANQILTREMKKMKSKQIKNLEDDNEGRI